MKNFNQSQSIKDVRINIFRYLTWLKEPKEISKNQQLELLNYLKKQAPETFAKASLESIGNIDTKKAMLTVNAELNKKLKINFSNVIDSMRSAGMATPLKKIQIKIPDAEKKLRDTFSFFIKEENRELQWIPAYDKVAEWLKDNNGKGIFMFGDVGLGKSVLGRYVLPFIIHSEYRKVVRTFDVDGMNANIDLIKSKRIVSLDDIGTEEQVIDFGNRREAFAEIIDKAEKTGQILIISSNLGKPELKARYGDRVFDRILNTTKRVVFRGESFRK